MNEKNSTQLLGVIDRIEDDKIVVININDRNGSIYIKKSAFKFKVYEGMWVRINFSPEPKKEEEMKLQIEQLQKKLLSRKNKK